MELVVREDGHIEMSWAGKPRLKGFGLVINRQKTPLKLQDLAATPWEKTTGTDVFGQFQLWQRRLAHGGVEILEERLYVYPESVRHEIRFLAELSDLWGSLDFCNPGVWLSTFVPASECAYFLCTFGLDGKGGEYPGGYWPEAMWGKVGQGFPAKPFVPLVIFDENGAVALAPAELFLLSPLVARGQTVGRALAGDFPKIPEGTTLSTWFAWGKDPSAALQRLGEFLTARKEKRTFYRSHPLLSRLGYWNAYGSYYTELIHPMEERVLQVLATEFRAKKLPVGYFGLDLWYPYERIGQALTFRPDEKKYPRGLRALHEETEIPYVLHLSALSPKNEYNSDGADPAVYEEIAAELKRQSAVGVWHDWLRTWQFITPPLLGDPWKAERWFSGMCQAFRKVDLPVLLCMQTMGMVLASTKEPNVVAARSYTDHLFSQELALRRAAKTDPEITKAKKKPVHIWLQNLSVGYVQWALELAPFHDLFLSRRHPGFGGEHAWEEAVMRALSCGPVGFGDACGMANQALLARLVLPDGRLGQPSRPPEPLWPTLRTPTPVFWTETEAGDLTWIYVVVLNLSKEPLSVRLSSPKEGEYLVWDPQSNRLASWDVMVPPEGLSYLVLLPVVEGAGLLGCPELLVPLPARAQVVARRENGKLEIIAPQGLGLHAVLCTGKMAAVEALPKIRVRRRG